MTGAASSAKVTGGLTRRLKDEANRLGFEATGVARIQPSDHAALYRAWLDAGMHGEMAYLARPDAVEARLDPRSRWPELRTALIVTLRYDGDGEECPSGRGRGGSGQLGGDVGSAADGARRSFEDDPSRGIIARYARGRDYHKVVKKKLLALLDWLETEVGQALPVARAYVDTGPVLERELARRAGLGWFGRNTMLLHPRRGSYFFLGTLLTELDLEPDEPFDREHCGTCNACVDACPTGALLGRDQNGAPVMDARRCISYLTIEHRGPIPHELRPLIGNRVFGCDICQEVCPWNNPKFVQLTGERDCRPDWRQAEDRPEVPDGLPVTHAPSLVELMAMTREEWDLCTRGSALRRAGYAGFKRNVAVALGNWGSQQAVPALVEALLDSESLVRGHAAWALGEIPSPSASAALADRLGVEDDPWVREELELARARFSDRSSSQRRSGPERRVT